MTEDGAHPEVLLALERLYLALAFNNKSYGNALHTSCRQCRLNLAPEQRRKREANEAVEHATCLLGINKIHIEMSRTLDGCKDGWLCYLVEHDAVCFLLVQPEHLTQVP